ncbi:N-acetylneuraminate synthase [Polynucleobacter paneuropaeus]|nr:N-acetylneuraminate synthase [Polynucleobacter paneuropaeus]
MKISNHELAGSSPLIIAEAGVNHNGDLSKALLMVEVAAAAGADFIKFQTFKADKLATSTAIQADYQTNNTNILETQREMLVKLELDELAHHEIIKQCSKSGIRFLSTAFDESSLDFLLSLDISLIKIPSGEITNLPYLRRVAQLGLPVILSTGMSEMTEVRDAIQVLQQGGVKHSDLTVLHCTTDYPTKMIDVNLRAMTSLQHEFKVKVGYSDHTMGIEVATAAVALGASVIEKHFTLDRRLPGPDHAASLEPAELRAMVYAIRNVTTALGDGFKEPRPAEVANRSVARKSIVAACDIKSGELFSGKNITTKRPGTGISPMLWDDVIGRKASRDFTTDELIKL